MTLADAHKLTQTDTVITKSGCEAYVYRVLPGEMARIRFVRSNKLLDYPLKYLTLKET